MSHCGTEVILIAPLKIFLAGAKLSWENQNCPLYHSVSHTLLELSLNTKHWTTKEFMAESFLSDRQNRHNMCHAIVCLTPS